MSESWKTRIQRLGFNLFPAYRGTGARFTYIAGDWSEARIRLPLSWRTRNYVGTIYGGAMYGAVDPIYMVMLMKRLGPGYVVWDKAASIRFLRPGRSTLFATFILAESVVDEIRQELTRVPKLDRTFEVELTDREGVQHALVEKVLHVRRDPSSDAVAG